jgi:D-alanyl-D-alanine carboxypeptidase
MNERLEGFRQRHGVAAIGAATIDTSSPTIESTDVAGVVRRGTNDAVVENDAWHIGSCAKALAAALYARLVEQGRAEWHARLVDLFPDLADSMDRGWTGVTIDELFTCRSGLPANPDRAAMRTAYDDPEPAVGQRSRAARAALTDPPDGRGRFRYSNLGYVLAGAAIDRITDSAFESAMRTEILDPLGVTTAGFGPPPRLCGHRARVRLGSLCIGRGESLEPDDLRGDNPPLLTPAGRLHLSLTDWALVQRLFLDGAGLLGQASLHHILRTPSDGRGMAMGWAAPKGLPGVALGMQGSNTAWVATALIDADRRRMTLVITNDGRTSMLRSTALLATELLRGGSA